MKVVVTTIGSLGDVHPCVALCLELKRRAHEVVIATSEFYHQKIASTGLGFHSIGPKHLRLRIPNCSAALWIQGVNLRNFSRRLLMPHMRGVYGDLLATCSGPNFLITGDLVFAAPLVAERLGIRWASCVLAPWQFLSAHDPSTIGPMPLFALLREAGVTMNRAIKVLGRRQAKSWAEPIYALRKELGLSAARHPLFEDKCSPYLNLAMFKLVALISMWRCFSESFVTLRLARLLRRLTTSCLCRFESPRARRFREVKKDVVRVSRRRSAHVGNAAPISCESRPMLDFCHRIRIGTNLGRRLLTKRQ